MILASYIDFVTKILVTGRTTEKCGSTPLLLTLYAIPIEICRNSNGWNAAHLRVEEVENQQESTQQRTVNSDGPSLCAVNGRL